MKTARQQTAEIQARLAAEEAFINAQEETLQAAMTDYVRLKAQIGRPHDQALAAMIQASHAADAAFLAWRRGA